MTFIIGLTISAQGNDVKTLMIFTVLFAIFPVGIIRLPKMYANFVEEQYSCVFAIALPYTNPFKSVVHGLIKF